MTTFRQSVLLLISLCYAICVNCSPSSVNSTNKVRTRPNYFELRRQKITTSSSTTTTEIPTTENLMVVEEEDEEEPPRIFGNSRGGREFAQQQEITSDIKENVTTELPRTKTSKMGGRSYLEYFRPGARPRTLRITTKRPKKVVVAETFENTNNNPPNGCNQCRYYCKQCRGTEEVTTGGVWGCCNHNCCGGRCSCQKVKIE